MTENKSAKNSAVRISIIYIIIGSFWILSSDKILYGLIQDPTLLTQFQTFKGWFFILITAITLFLLINRDIKLLKSAQKDLSYSEEKFFKAFQKSPDLIAISTFDEGRYIDVNEGFIETSGYSKDEIIGKTSSELNVWPSPDDREKFTRIFKEKEVIKNLEVNLRKKNGERVICLVSAEVIFFNNVKCIISISRDITDRKMAEESLKHSEEVYRQHLEKTVEERTSSLKQLNEQLAGEIKKQKISEEKIQNQLEFLKTLINTIPKPVFIKGKDRKYIDCNRAFEEFFRKPKDEITGSTVHSIFPKETAEINDQKDSELLNNPGSQLLELHFADNFGQEHDIVINKATYNDLEGSIGGIIGVIEDITEHRQMQSEINKALEKEKELSTLKSRFISTASHEFRTPLTVILASADLLEMFGRNWKEEKYKEHTSKIRRTVKYMIELLDDVLTISRTETGRISFKPGEVNFYKLCCEVLENVKLKKNEKHDIRFTYNSPVHNLMADEKLLRQILLNLLVNAVKYSPGGGVIKFIADVSDNNISIEISDQGIGIPEENIPVLFEPFNRGENVGDIPGTGLGLSIVKKSVEMHNGTISLRSKLNEGTTFYINIPTA